MKLSNAQIAAVANATGADPLPEEDPAQAQLREAVGDHTFYVDQEGLLVLDPPEGAAAPEQVLEVVRVGEWADEQKRTMGLTPPQRTGQVLDLSAAGDGTAPDGPDRG